MHTEIKVLSQKRKKNTRIKDIIKYKSIKCTTMNNSIAWHNTVVWKAWKVSVSKELVISEYLVLNSDASRLFDENEKANGNYKAFVQKQLFW